MSYWELFFRMLKVNLLSFGGGQIAIAIYYEEFVATGHIEEEDFEQIVLMSNIFPGGMILYLSGFIAIYMKGKKGLVVSMIAITIPIMVLVVVVYEVLKVLSIDLTKLILLVLPFLFIMTYEYSKRVNASKLSMGIKYFIFFITIFAIVVFNMEIIVVILLFIAISLCINSVREIKL